MISYEISLLVKVGLAVLGSWLAIFIVAGIAIFFVSDACAAQTGCRTTTIFEPGGRIIICTTCCNVFGNCTVNCS